MTTSIGHEPRAMWHEVASNPRRAGRTVGVPATACALAARAWRASEFARAAFLTGCACLFLGVPFARVTLASDDSAPPPRADYARLARQTFQSPTRSFPWYDAKQDRLKPIRFKPPRDWKLNWNWPFRWGRLPTSSIQWAAWLIIGLVLGWLLYLLLQAYLRRAAQAARRPRITSSTPTGSSHIEALPDEARVHLGDLLAAARHAYQQGNYRQAIIYLFSHQLVELDQRQRIHLARGKTNRQYLRELSPHPPLRGLLEQSMLAFEAVFFGNCPLSRAEFETCWNRLDEFRALLHAEGAS